MALENRGNYGPYYYHKRREGQQVISEYVGTGLLAQFAVLDRQREKMVRHAWNVEKAADWELERVVEETGSFVRALVAAVCLAHGYHSHRRQWRELRESNMAVKAIEVTVTPTDDVVPEDHLNRFVELVNATNKENPKKADVAALRKYLKDFPQAWRIAGDLATQAYIRLCEGSVAGKAQKESLITGYHQLQKGMSTPSDGELERLLTQQIALSWLRLQLLEHRLTVVTKGSYSMREAEHFEKRLSAAQRRFLRACETLARIRKMGLPPIQVNIGQNQMNQVNT